jgi:hypothetical protein
VFQFLVVAGASKFVDPAKIANRLHVATVQPEHELSIARDHALTAAGRQLPPTVLTAIGGLRAPLAKLDQAFGVAPAATS